MKKILLFGFGLMTWAAFAQVEIRNVGETTNLDGQTLTVTIPTSEVDPNDEYAYWAHTKFHVYNLSGGDLQMRLRRDVVTAATDWVDQICWPPTCFPTNQVATYLTPHSNPSNPAPIVFDGGTTTDKNGGSPAEIKPQIYPKHPGSSATYKYTVVDVNNATEYASVTVIYNYIDDASVKAVKNTEITFSPNPASDAVTIQAEAITNGSIQIVDVLGNVVYTSNFSGTKKINTSDMKNGVYIVSIQGDNAKGITKKLVVRH